MSARDYQRILDLTVAILDSHRVTLPWDVVRVELGELFDSPSKALFSTTGWDDSPVGSTPTDVHPGLEALEIAMHAHPLVRHYQRTADSRPLTPDALYVEGRWPDPEAQHVFAGMFGAEHQLALPLPAPTGIGHLIMLGRTESPYTGRDQEVAGRIQPLFAAVVRHLAYAHTLPAPQGGGPEDTLYRAAELRLTPRETVVLSRLAKSLTAEAIARRLGISPRSAHKHLENLYRKFGTGDRLSTVLHAREMGLLTAD
ncbi:LuxR C-terminal-related transcriptional regulator [Streptomyces sp. NPDC001415]